MSENVEYLKGTTTVGIVCKEGIVLAADMRATAGNLIVNKKTDKLYELSDDVIVTMAGTVSDAQLVLKWVKAELNLMRIRNNKIALVKEVANLLGNIVYSNVRRMSLIPGVTHFLLGGRDDNGFELYDVFADGSVTLIDDFVSSGSGSVTAYGVLETQYNKNLTVEEGIKLALRSVNAALQRDTYSGNGINIAVVAKEGVKRVMSQELNTQ